MKTLQKQYFDCCDRLYLNTQSQIKMSRGSRVLEEQIEKDKKLKESLEVRLGI